MKTELIEELLEHFEMLDGQLCILGYTIYGSYDYVPVSDELAEVIGRIQQELDGGN